MGKRMNDLLLYATWSVGDSHNHRGAKKKKGRQKKYIPYESIYIKLTNREK